MIGRKKEVDKESNYNDQRIFTKIDVQSIKVQIVSYPSFFFLI